MHCVVRQYTQLQEYLLQWRDGVFPLLILSSQPGMGKSTLVKNLFQHTPERQVCFFHGKATAILLYETLYAHRDYPIVLDDTDALLGNKDCLELLKALLHSPGKDSTIQWLTKTRLADGVVRSFTTSSPVCILTNTNWSNGNTHQKAIIDRGISLVFTPGKHDIHAYAEGMVEREVYQWFSRYLPLIPSLSLRAYSLAESFNKFSLYWQYSLCQLLGFSELESQIVMVDMSYPDISIEDKCARFKEKYPDVPTRAYTRIFEQLETA